MPSDTILVVFPRVAALVPILFAAFMVWTTIHSRHSSKHSRGMKRFILFGMAVGVFSALVFAYHILLGHPLSTRSDSGLAKWGTVVGKVKSAND